MTFRTLALATALTSATALTAFAADEGGTERQAQDNSGVDAIYEETQGNAATAQSGNWSDVTVAEDGEIHAPTDLDLTAKGEREAGKTLVENILAEAETGATLTSVDDKIIGEVASHEGDKSAEHLIYVDVSAEADLAAERIGFEAGTLSVGENGGLEYAMTLAQLRTAVAEKVATMTQ
jgi:hypothetical protein|tara:strand:- start:42 stop:578 length:537 start_codon:yes stop_codon:yes gene_type:complete